MTKTAARLSHPDIALNRPRAQAVAAAAVRVAAMLRARNRHAPDALTVHVRALRLFAPGSPALGDADAAVVLGRIAALASHLSSPLSGR